MADSLTGMGSFELFPLEPNWAKSPSASAVFVRHYESYPGTAQKLGSLTSLVPITMDMGFTLEKADEYAAMAFFAARRGRWQRFWFKGAKRAFTLKEDMASGSTVLYVYDNGAYDLYQGHERIYIEMRSGDLIVRHVTSITDDTETNQRLILLLDTALDRDVNLDNHWKIGRLLLGRVNMDKILLRFKTSHASEITGRFMELPTEYSEI